MSIADTTRVTSAWGEEEELSDRVVEAGYQVLLKNQINSQAAIK